MNLNVPQYEKRKQDHIKLALMTENQAESFNFFDRISLIHEALPDFDFDEIDISTHRFNQKIPKPFLISSMTAGHQDSISINERLFAACDHLGWALGVGSQRRELSDGDARKEWTYLKEVYPHVKVFSNLGISQLITTPFKKIEAIIEALAASALIIHCNPLQECLQEEGTPLFKGSWRSIEELVKKVSIPVVIKETGCGFSKNTLVRLSNIGVAAVDVSGLGGTHWGRIEGGRASSQILKTAAQSFQNWGIDTIHSMVYAKEINPKYEIWGSGGVRSGLDAAKLFSLGATMVGFAKLILQAALESTDAVIMQMKTIEYELKVAMFCTGSLSLKDLEDKHFVNE